MHKTTRRRLVVAAALTPVAIATFPQTASADSTVDPATEWYDLTAAVITASGASAQVANSRTWAIGWLAAARALRRSGDADFQHAALASAVHEVLRDQIPSRAGDLDAALAASLARIPDGRAKQRGVTTGSAEARALLTDRVGDGLDPASVNAPFTPDPPAPGVWQPTPPAFGGGQQSGTRYARPFLLSRADRFRPPPPPPLGSSRNTRDLAEVRAFGARESSVRTPAQTATAQFWLGSSLVLYNGILRAALVQSRRSLAWRTGLVGLFHVALVDTQIATSDAKYHYRTWRPVTAIRALHDPQWTPLHDTPSHPDYVSGHNIYSGAAEAVLTDLTGPSARPYTIGSPSAPGLTRTYTDWATPSRENVDARVWSGIHTRIADEAGIALGKKVARHTLDHAHRLLT
ncbi:vanadium-dependent haloperoxidase [Phytomonospora sp. NPDC050363]|uniref:vanadium-dependent haloperoxidase n=1 Tax=Phytomonospora sp. NPDC050363 TaxID=3155642 RepID=UPI0033E6541D